MKVMVATDLCGSSTQCNHDFAIEKARACRTSANPLRIEVGDSSHAGVERTGIQKFKTMFPFFKQ